MAAILQFAIWARVFAHFSISLPFDFRLQLGAFAHFRIWVLIANLFFNFGLGDIAS
jgi:hypothetical protein